MKKGFTLLEVIVSMTFLGLITIGFLVATILVNQNIKKVNLQNAELTDLYNLENELNNLHQNYVNDHLTLKNTDLYLNDQCLLKIDSYDNLFCYQFISDVKIYFKYLVNYEIIDNRLLKISAELPNYRFSKFYLFKEVNYEGYA